MAGLRDAFIDGLALVLVGSGLTAGAVSYVRAIPDPGVQVAGTSSVWEEPVTTGSITPRAQEPREGADDPTLELWTDPPPRGSGSRAREPF